MSNYGMNQGHKFKTWVQDYKIIVVSLPGV